MVAQRNGTKAEEVVKAHNLPNANCYGYACGFGDDRKLSPGELAEAKKVKGARAVAFDQESSEEFKAQVVNDGLIYLGVDWASALVDAKNAQEKGYYLLAGFRGTRGITHGDHHWFRRHQDGSWSQKQGLASATWLDANSAPILDSTGGPEKAAKDTPKMVSIGQHSYEELIGYFLCPDGVATFPTPQKATGCTCVVQ